MATVLDTLAANLRTKLSLVSGLTPLPENVSMDDLPDSDKVFFAVEPGTYDELDNEHGGGTLVGHLGEVFVRLAWMLDDDEEAHTDTRAIDLQAIRGVVAKASNWTAGIVLVTAAGDSSSTEDTLNRVDLTYRVRYRVAQDLT